MTEYSLPIVPRFAEVDQQYIRVFTVVSDVHLPIGLQVGAMGEITPVIGDVTDAFTNLTVKNSEAVTETPDQLAMLFPTLLNLILPQLSSGLPAISLPTIGNLQLANGQNSANMWNTIGSSFGNVLGGIKF